MIYIDVCVYIFTKYFCINIVLKFLGVVSSIESIELRTVFSVFSNAVFGFIFWIISFKIFITTNFFYYDMSGPK